ncbi:FAS1 domain-containing protein [Paraphysoderma sedebokerense]|nr:FAS1 domain-containing protein [Paraphysoderma sedebokerense]
MISQLVLLFTLAALATAQDASKNVAENVITLSGQVHGKHYTLKTLLGLAQNATGIVDALSQTPNITLFAPTDEAFAELLRTSAPKAENIPDILKYHVLPSVFAPPAKPFQVLPTLLKAPSPLVGLEDGKSQVLGITVGSGVTVSYGLGNAQVIDSIQSSNGIIHVVSKVLVPPQSPSATAVAANLTQLVGALKKADLVSAVDSAKGVTIFAPLDTAFAAIASTAEKLTAAQLGNVLKYHVVPAVAYSTDVVSGAVTGDVKTLQGETINVRVVDGKVKINDATVVLADVFTSNGVVHVIDGVLLPKNLDAAPQSAGPNSPNAGTSPSPNANASGNTAGPASGAITAGPASLFLAVVSKVLVPPHSPSAAAVAANLTQLVEALKKADLVSAVDSAKGVTIFAPFDPAITAVRVEVGALTTSQLGNVLKYHVVPTVSYSTDFVSGAVKTLQGETLNITVVDGKIKEVNGYSVRLTDVFTSNGVVHVFEGVLIPKNLDAAPQPTGPNAPKNGSNSPNNNSNNNRNISGDNGANPTSAAADSCPVGIILAASAILAILSM